MNIKNLTLKEVVMVLYLLEERKNKYTKMIESFKGDKEDIYYKSLKRSISECVSAYSKIDKVYMRLEDF